MVGAVSETKSQNPAECKRLTKLPKLEPALPEHRQKVDALEGGKKTPKNQKTDLVGVMEFSHPMVSCLRATDFAWVTSGLVKTGSGHHRRHKWFPFEV